MNLNHKKICFNILQAFPVNGLNTDDVGSVKTCQVGGTTRTRISSQCFKRSTRLAAHELGIETGVRTRRLAELLEEQFAESHPDIAESARKECAEAVNAALSDNAAVYISSAELEAIDAIVTDAAFEPKLAAKEVAVMHSKLNRGTGGHDGLDIALFGRMVAKVKSGDMDVQAAAAFSHAYTTHTSLSDIDFFITVDDLDTVNPSAFLGTREFSSGVFYRFVTLNLDLLKANLGIRRDEDLREAVKIFTKALFLSVPTGRQSGFAAMRCWDYCHAVVQTGQPAQCLFDVPVTPKGNSGLIAPSIEAMEAEISRAKTSFGSLCGIKSELCFKAGETSVDDFAEALANEI